MPERTELDPKVLQARKEAGLCYTCGKRDVSPGVLRCGPCFVRQYRFSELRRARRGQHHERAAHYERQLGLEPRKPPTGKWEKHHANHH